MARPRKHAQHLPRCVYERHGAYWYVRKGKWIRLAATLPEALAKYAEYVSQPEGGMAELIDRALAHMWPKLSPQTRMSYASSARHLKHRLVEFAPHQVMQRHVAAIKVDMAGTPNMANRCLSVLKLVFAQAVEWQIVESNPCIGIRALEERERDRYISNAEYAAIYAKADSRLQVILDLLYLTGQRVNDVLGIRYSDLNDVGIDFRPSKTKKSTGARVTVKWTPELRAVVDRAKRLDGNVTALTLMHGRNGRAPHYRTISAQWRRAADSAGIPDVQLRDMRAKALTDAEEQGLDPTALASHSSVQMTKRYIRRRKKRPVSGPNFGQSIRRGPK
jgi:integrase